MRHLMEVGVDSLKLFLDMDVSLGAIVPHKEAVLALAADRLADSAGMSYEHVKDALARRERLGSTALGRGVAMPHAMSRHCTRPAAVLVGLSHPIDFDAPDDADVDVVFALIWPHDRPQEFLKLSATASRILADPAILALIRKSADPGLIRRSIYFNAQVDRGCAGDPCDLNGDVMAFSGRPSDREAASWPIQRGANGS